MNRSLLLIFFIWFFLFTKISGAASFYQFQGAYRSFPKSASGEVHFYFNEKIWSNQTSGESWQYGFWRLGAFAALHGQVGLKVDVYPISILQLSLQRSLTSRFYDTQTLDCMNVECRGSVQRGTLKTSLVLGYGDIFFVPSFTITDISSDQNKKDFSSEEDNLVAALGGDQLSIRQLTLGYKSGDQRWALVSRSSKMKLSKDHNLSKYLVWNKIYNPEINYFIGAGIFESSHADRSFSFISGISWTVGDNLALF